MGLFALAVVCGGYQLLNQIEFGPAIDWKYTWTSFGPIRRNYPIPYFSAKSANGDSITSEDLIGKFTFVIIDHDLSQGCMNTECGPDAEVIVSKGGHLVGFSSIETARVFGLRQHTEQAYSRVVITMIIDRIRQRRNRRKQDYLDSSLLIVADKYGIVKAIFKHGHMDDLPYILKLPWVFQ